MPTHTDLETLKQTHRLEDVVARYGIELRRQGRALVGRCPFHADGGRPNLHVWPDTASWWCFRCCSGGDVIRFVQLAENFTFPEALEKLRSCSPIEPCAPHPPKSKRQSERERATNERDPEEVVALQAATNLYHRRLLTDTDALAYVQGRGLDLPTIVNCRIGYAAGDELLAHMRWRSLPLGPAMRVGLLDAAGRESLAGRVVVPELRSGSPVWLVGRILQTASCPPDAEEASVPKYLGLRGAKRLLGADQVRNSPSVLVCEGVFDYLTLRGWGYPAVALAGTHASAQVVDELRAFQRAYLVMDQDEAGLEATLGLLDKLGPAAVPVTLPDGVKDVAELAPRPDGRELFAAALLDAVGAPIVTGDADSTLNTEA
jgi:DNA primase